MQKTVLPNSMIIHFLLIETYEDGEQDISVDRAILPDTFEEEVFAVEQKVNLNEKLSPAEEQVLRMAFHLQADEVENVTLEIATVMFSDHLGRVSY